MNNKIYGSFNVVGSDKVTTESVYPTVNMEIDQSATLDDMLYAFKNFLISIGYVISSDEEIVIQDNRVSENDYYLINENKFYKGEF
jgi:hypothetical protein